MLLSTLIINSVSAQQNTKAGPAARPNFSPWNPPVSKGMGDVDAGIECPLSEVLTGTGARIEELVDNLQKFDATESLEHYNVTGATLRGKPKTRVFDYVAIITLSEPGRFELDEYRNGRVDPSQFPANIATTGLAAMALMFHPTLVSDFQLTCEGLGQWGGHPAWQLQFAQRPDRPNRLRAYAVGRLYHPLSLRGRAWIDPKSYQVWHLESDLTKPMPEIRLSVEHIAIDYGPVTFQSRGQQLWLPIDAKIYWERNKRRFYRHHSFSPNFKMFEVDSNQQIQTPKKPD